MPTTPTQNNDDELIRLYEEFIMRFETICAFLRFTILVLFFPNYTQEQYRRIEILLEGIAADSLRKKVLCLIVEQYTDKSEIYKLAKEVYKQVEKIIPLRNSFAHGTPLLNKFSIYREFDDGHLVLKHPKLKTEGLDFNFITLNVDRLNTLVSNMQYLGNAVELLYMVIRQERSGNIITESFIGTIKNNLANIKNYNQK